jgi:hypothetical protein
MGKVSDTNLICVVNGKHSAEEGSDGRSNAPVMPRVSIKASMGGG